MIATHLQQRTWSSKACIKTGQRSGFIAATKDAHNTKENVCPPQGKMSGATLGQACPAHLHQTRSNPPSSQVPPTEFPAASAPRGLGTHTSHPSPRQRPESPSPCRTQANPVTARPQTHRPHQTLSASGRAGPTPQRPAVHGGAEPLPNTANEPAGKWPRCTPENTLPPPRCLPGNVVPPEWWRGSDGRAVL